jgi:hypothetical protein
MPLDKPLTFDKPNIFESLDKIHNFIEKSNINEPRKKLALDFLQKFKKDLTDYATSPSNPLPKLDQKEKIQIEFPLHPDKGGDDNIFKLFSSTLDQIKKTDKKSLNSQYQEYQKQTSRKPISEKIISKSTNNIFTVIKKINDELEKKITDDANQNKKPELLACRVKLTKIKGYLDENYLPLSKDREAFTSELSELFSKELAQEFKNEFDNFSRLIKSDREDLIKQHKTQSSAPILPDSKHDLLADILIARFTDLQTSDQKFANLLQNQFTKDFNTQFPTDKVSAKKFLTKELQKYHIMVEKDGSIKTQLKLDTTSAPPLTTSLETLCSSQKLDKKEMRNLGLDTGLPSTEELLNSFTDIFQNLSNSISQSNISTSDKQIPQSKPAYQTKENPFLFDSHISKPVPDDKKDQLVEILVKKYTESFNKKDTDGQSKIFFEFFSEAFNTNILQDPKSPEAPEPRIFKQKLQEFFLKNTLKIDQLGAVEIAESDKTDYINETFGFFLNQTSSRLTKEEFTSLDLSSSKNPFSEFFKPLIEKTSQESTKLSSDFGNFIQESSQALQQTIQDFSKPKPIETSNTFAPRIVPRTNQQDSSISSNPLDFISGLFQPTHNTRPLSKTSSQTASFNLLEAIGVSQNSLTSKKPSTPPKLETPSNNQNFDWLGGVSQLFSQKSDNSIQTQSSRSSSASNNSKASTLNLSRANSVSSPTARPPLVQPTNSDKTSNPNRNGVAIFGKDADARALRLANINHGIEFLGNTKAYIMNVRQLTPPSKSPHRPLTNSLSSSTYRRS